MIFCMVFTNWKYKKVKLILVRLHKDGNRYFVVHSDTNDFVKIRYEELTDLKEFLQKANNSGVFWLHVEGTGVLTRFVDRPAGYKGDIIVNGDKEDFYFSSYSDGEQSIVSFVRKQLIEPLLEVFSDLKLHLLNMTCGKVPLLQLMDGNDTFKGEYTIGLQGGKLKTLERAEPKTGEIVFKGNYADEIQFVGSAVFGLMNFPKEGMEFCFSEEEKTKALQEFREHRRFNTIGLAGIGLVLLVVVGNYFYINQLNNTIATMEDELSLGNENLSLLDKLEQERERKEQLVEASGFLGNKYISFYLDKIGQSVPPTIDLQELDVFPLKEKLKEKQKVTVDTKKIWVTGTTDNSVVLDDWMEKMNRFEWVKSVEVINYSKMSDQQAAFSLLIQLNQ